MGNIAESIAVNWRAQARTPTAGSRRRINVGTTERWMSAVAGAALATIGATRRSLPGAGVALLGGELLWRGASGHCFLYQALGINTAAQPEQVSVPYGTGIRVDQSVIVNKPAAELYDFWRRLENLPLFMSHLESVHGIDEKRSHWRARSIGPTTIQWDAEIINEVEGELIGWRSLESSDIEHAGSVHFRDLQNGSTEVQVVLRYLPTAGAAGAAFASLFGDEPDQTIRRDLQQLKAILESSDASQPVAKPGRLAMFRRR